MWEVRAVGKKPLFVAISVLVLAAGCYLAASVAVEPPGQEVIRLHIIAHSDSEEDQAVKRAVRDCVLGYLGPQFKEVSSVARAKHEIAAHLGHIETLANDELAAWGKGYGARAEFGEFLFPATRYGRWGLPAGQYQALKIVLGEGKGENWWCILFPPLCFVDATGKVSMTDTGPSLPASADESTGRVVKFRLLELLGKPAEYLARR